MKTVHLKLLVSIISGSIVRSTRRLLWLIGSLSCIFIHLTSAEPIIKKLDATPEQVKKILSSYQITTGKPFSEFRLKSAIETIYDEYREQGYYFARCVTQELAVNSDSTKINIELEFKKGPLLEIEKIEFLGLDSSELCPIKTVSIVQEGRILMPSVLDNAMERIVTYFENRGYPFAEVKLTKFQYPNFVPDTIVRLPLSLGLDIDKGEFVQVDFIDLAGAGRTRESFIANQMHFRVGEVFSNRRLEKQTNSIRRIEFLKLVREPELIQAPTEQWGYRISINELKSNRVSGILGYQPADDDEDQGTLVGDLTVDVINIWGGGRKLFLNYEHLEAGNKKFKVAFSEPWVFNSAIGARLAFAQEVYESLYTKLVTELTFSYPLSFETALLLNLSWRLTVPESLGIYQHNIPKSYKFSTGLGIEVDLGTWEAGLYGKKELDYIEDSKSGPSSLFDDGEGRFSNLLASATEIRLGYSFISEQRLFVQSNLKSYLFDDADLPEPDLFKIGGTKSVRGYKEEQFISSSVGFSQLEYQIRFQERSVLFSFFDVGLYELGNRYEVVYGYGAGIRFDLPVGLLGISYGLSPDRGIDAGIIHFALAGEF